MIFDKYIALIVEKIERHAAIVTNEIKDENKILQSEIGALHAKFDDRNELFEKIVKLEEKNLELERENRLLEEATEGVQEEFISVSEKLEKVLKDWGEAGEEHLKREACSAAEIERQKAFIKNAEGMLATAEKTQVEQRATIASLEHEVQSGKAVVKGLTERNVEAVAKADRLLALAKEYDKATVAMLNAVLERKSAVEERKVWEAAKGALKERDAPKRKAGRPKRQS
jgi:hypothetical protein